MKVFIGGSRAVSKLNAVIRGGLDDLMKRGCTILIGDANGADKAVQTYFAKERYAKVIVFCMEQVSQQRWGLADAQHSAASGQQGVQLLRGKRFRHG